MFATRSSRRLGVAYAILVGVSLLLLAVSGTAPARRLQDAAGFVFAPAQGALAGVTRGAASVVSALAEIDQLRRDNQALQTRNQQLEVENRQLQEVKIQNQQLATLLQVKSSLDYQTVAATVIGREVSRYVRMVTIDEGSSRGVEVGDVVVAGGAALVGRVVEVGPNFSRILLISDTRSTVVGLIESSRATGDVIGQLGGSLVMTDIAATERVNLGDTVVTAGIDLGNGIRSPFPKGLLIGQVVDVQRDPNSIVQTAFVNPASNLDKLEYVLVITNYHGGLPPLPGASSQPGASPGTTAIPLPSAPVQPAP